MTRPKSTKSTHLPTDSNLSAIQSRGGETHQEESTGGAVLTTNQGVALSDNQNSLKAGDREPTLLEDFILREKITHFDHERIPERIVHARGSAARGYFQPYKSMKHVTSAAFLSGPKFEDACFRSLFDRCWRSGFSRPPP